MSQQQTKCPSCHATYPMPSNKLGDLNAKARCGRCQQIFLLNDNLVLPEDTQKKKGINLDAFNAINQKMPPPTKPIQKEQPTPTSHVADDDIDDEFSKAIKVSFSDRELDNFMNNDVNLQKPMMSTLDEQKSQQEDEAWIRDLLDDTKVSTVTQNISQRPTPQGSSIDFNDIIPAAAPTPKKTVAVHRILAKKDPTAQELASKRSATSQLMWFVGCILLAVVLVTQYVFFNITTIAKNPSHADTLNSLCGIVGCAVPIADLASLKIEQHHDSKDYTTNIIINIKNTNPNPVLFPNLLVTAKDVNGKVLGEFVVSDKEYIAKGQNSLLHNQHKRIMFTIHTVNFTSTILVKPFY